jgi:hypothetical protein
VEPGKKKCLEHLKDQSFRVQRDKKRRKRDARNAEKEAKRGKPENVANALEALLRSKRRSSVAVKTQDKETSRSNGLPVGAVGSPNAVKDFQSPKGVSVNGDPGPTNKP